MVRTNLRIKQYQTLEIFFLAESFKMFPGILTRSAALRINDFSGLKPNCIAKRYLKQWA